MLSKLAGQVQEGVFARVASTPGAAELCLGTVAQALRAAVGKCQADCTATLVPILVTALQELASRPAACQVLLPLLQDWLSQRTRWACAAVLQPVVLVAALKSAGVKGYLEILHPAVIECSLAGPGDESVAAWDGSMQVCSPGFAQCAADRLPMCLRSSLKHLQEMPCFL